MQTRTSNRSLRLHALLLAACLLVSASTVPAMAGGTPVTIKEAGGNLGFGDVPASNWAYSAIMWMARNGILNGVGEGLFRPDDAATREQFAITAIYGGHTVKVPGNAIEVVLPVSQAEGPLPAATVKYAKQTDGVLLAWTKISDSGFPGTRCYFEEQQFTGLPG